MHRFYNLSKWNYFPRRYKQHK